MSEPGKENGKDTAALLRQHGSRVVYHDGYRFRIGRVLQSQLLAAGFHGPIVGILDSETPEDARRKLLEDNITDWAKLKEATVRAGLLEPKIWDGAEIKCPPDQVMLYDIAQQIDELFRDIMALTGLTPEAADAARFRDPDEASASVGGHGQGGGEVAKRGPQPAAGS